MKGSAKMLIPFVDESLQRINRIVSDTAGVQDNYDAAHNAINDSFLEFAQKAKPIIDSYISSLGELGVEQCSTAREVCAIAFLFSITGYSRWGRVFCTSNEAMNAARSLLSSLSSRRPFPRRRRCLMSRQNHRGFAGLSLYPTRIVARSEG